MHRTPVWGHRVDSAVYAPVDLDGLRAETWEVLPARAVADDVVEVCSIPLFVYDVNLGDQVAVIARDIDGSGDRVACFHGVVRKGGHWTFRVDLGETANPPLAEELERHLGRSGCLFEWWDPTLCAIDVPDSARAQEVADHLLALERRGRLEYETGRTGKQR
jgi:hypothetical protein